MKNPFKKSLEVSILGKQKYPTKGKSPLLTCKYDRDEMTMKEKPKGKSPLLTCKYDRNEGIEGKERD